MSSSLRRGALAATAVAISLVTLSACGAGNDAATLQIRPDHAAVTAGQIKIQSAVVITQGRGEEGPAAISAKIFNSADKAQTIESVTVKGTNARVELSPAEGSGQVTVPANGSVTLGGEGNASAVFDNGGAVQEGDAQPLVFQFSKTGKVELKSFVVPAHDAYESFGPSQAATQSPSETGGAAPEESGTPGGSATPADGASESAAAGEEAQEDAANGEASPGADEHAGH